MGRYSNTLIPDCCSRNAKRRYLQVLVLPGYHQFLGPFARATLVTDQGNGSLQQALLDLVPTELTYQLAWALCFEYCSVH